MRHSPRCSTRAMRRFVTGECFKDYLESLPVLRWSGRTHNRFEQRCRTFTPSIDVGISITMVLPAASRTTS